jgi:hypothetical protein
MSLFNNYQYVNYLFGDETANAVFQNISTYIDLVDQVSDNGAFYEVYEIPDGYRPDSLSQILYGTSDYYWMFFLLNEKLRLQGWPLDNQQVYSIAKLYYPNTVLLTNRQMHGEFYRNSIIASPDNNSSPLTFNNPPFKAIILEKNYDLGQLVVKPIIEVRSVTINNGGSGYTAEPTVTFNGGGGTGAIAQAVINEEGVVTNIIIIDGGDDYTSVPTIIISNPQISNGVLATATAVLSTNGIANKSLVYSQKNELDTRLWDNDLITSLYIDESILQYNSAHHYKNSSSEKADLPISSFGGVDHQNLLTKTTYLDRLIVLNDELKQIKIFRPEVANQINSEFQKLARQQ